MQTENMLFKPGDLLELNIDRINIYDLDEENGYSWLGILNRGELFLIIDIVPVNPERFDGETHHRCFKIIPASTHDQIIANKICCFIAPGRRDDLNDLSKVFKDISISATNAKELSGVTK